MGRWLTRLGAQETSHALNSPQLSGQEGNLEHGLTVQWAIDLQDQNQALQKLLRETHAAMDLIMVKHRAQVWTGPGSSCLLDVDPALKRTLSPRMIL